jgi:hypothetical protein
MFSMDVHKVLKASRPPSDRSFNEDDPWYLWAAVAKMLADLGAGNG